MTQPDLRNFPYIYMTDPRQNISFDEFVKFFGQRAAPFYKHYELQERMFDTQSRAGEKLRPERRYVATMLAPSRDIYGRFPMVEAYSTNREVELYTGGAFADQLGSGYTNMMPYREDGTWYRTHTPSGVLVEEVGLGFCLYTGIGLNMAYYFDANGVYSVKNTDRDEPRSDEADAWWNKQVERKYVVTMPFAVPELEGSGGSAEEEITKTSSIDLEFSDEDLQQLIVALRANPGDAAWVDLQLAVPYNARTLTTTTECGRAELDLQDGSTNENGVHLIDVRLRIDRAGVIYKMDTYGTQSPIGVAVREANIYWRAYRMVEANLTTRQAHARELTLNKERKFIGPQVTTNEYGSHIIVVDVGEPEPYRLSVKAEMTVPFKATYIGANPCYEDPAYSDRVQVLTRTKMERSPFVLFGVVSDREAADSRGVARDFPAGKRPDYTIDSRARQPSTDGAYGELFDFEGNAAFTPLRAELAAKALHGPSELLAVIMLESIARASETHAVEYASRADIAELLANSAVAQRILAKARGQQSLPGLSGLSMTAHREIHGIHRTVLAGGSVIGSKSNPLNLLALSKSAQAALKQYGE